MIRAATAFAAVLLLAACSGLPEDHASAPANREPRPVTGEGQPRTSGQRVIDASDCIGAVVNGVCHGAISPRAQSAPQKTCHGQMIGGRCTGPMF